MINLKHRRIPSPLQEFVDKGKEKTDSTLGAKFVTQAKRAVSFKARGQAESTRNVPYMFEYVTSLEACW